MVLWHDRWFPKGRNESRGWRLDIVSLLAVIGESSVSVHAQEMTSSWTCLLPRLIPAPQALLQSFRPRRLDSYPATVNGVKSGTAAGELNFFANILHDIDSLKPYAFKWYRIEYKNKKENQEEEKQGRRVSIINNFKNDAATPSTDASDDPKIDVENGQVHPSHPKTTSSWKRTLTMGTLTEENTPQLPKKPPIVPSRRLSPANAVSVISCALSIGGMIWAGVIRDGVALIAVACLSIASSMIGAGLWWKPVLAVRPSDGKVPDGDVMIRTRTGAFIYVECNEQIARELYFGTERCDHYLKSTNVFRACSGCGTLLLMVSVVLLGNCSWVMQAVVGTIYLMLNGLYWATSLLRKRHFWDLSRYDCQPVTKDDPLFDVPAHEEIKADESKPASPPSFTRTLWYAIKATGETEWVKQTDAVPDTDPWDEWLKEAEKRLTGPETWDAIQAVKAKDRLMKREADRQKEQKQKRKQGPKQS